MRIANITFIVILSLRLPFCAPQQPSGQMAPSSSTTASSPGAATSAPSPSAPAASAATPSSLLQSSLDDVQQTLRAVKVDRWKRGSVRDEANADVNSLLVDLQQRVPGLLKDADAAPGTLSKTLPVSRHIDALYDVLLRVVEASRIAAPNDQADQLRLSLRNLERARLALDDSMELSASSQEKQLVDLHATVVKQAAFKCPAPAPAAECPKPAAKRPVRRKVVTPAPSGAQSKPSASGTPQKPAAGSTPAKPNPQKPK